MQQFTAHCWSHLQLELGEGVRWDERTGELLWVDVHRGRLQVATLLDTDLDTLREIDVEAAVTAVFPLPDPADGWLVGRGEGLAAVSRAGNVELLALPERSRLGHTRVNDGACDREGRLWLGSMEYAGAPDAGRLYRLDLDGRLTVALSPTTVSNGIGWSPDGSRMYFVDSGAGTVTAFAYSDGELADPRVVVRIEEPGAVPDGLCVDDEGCLWVAIWGAGEVRRFSSEGSQLARVTVPAARPSCCAFGGPDRDVLYLTTARVGLSETELSRQPHAGCLFAVDVGVTGPAASPYRGPLEVTDAT